MQTVLYEKKLTKPNAKIYELADGKRYKMNTKTKNYEQVVKELDSYEIKFRYINTWFKKKHNILLEVEDIEVYRQTCISIAVLLGIKIDFEFVNIKTLCKAIVHHSIKELPIVQDYNILETIDSACAGGSLLCLAGEHKGKYNCYDINNSYNAFFLQDNFKLPSDPEYKTIKEIPDDINEYALYRLKTKVEEKLGHLMKLKRKWYTNYDIQIFRQNNVFHELVDEPLNCITFKLLNGSDFKRLNKINDVKNTFEKDTIEKQVYKQCLSSLWGCLCEYHIVEESEGRIIDDKYMYKCCSKTGITKFKNPECIYKYSIAIIKPFVLAYGRMKLLEMVKKCYDKGYEVLYCHTDSITTDSPETLFDIGPKIGQWKIDKQSENGVRVINMMVKEYF